MDQIVHFLHKPIRFHGQINSKKKIKKLKKLKKWTIWSIWLKINNFIYLIIIKYLYFNKMDQIVHFLYKPIRFHGQINSKKIKLKN